MADKQVSMPASTAGLTSYFREYKSRIEFKPAHVIVFAAIVIIATILLHMFGGALIG